MPDKVGTAVFPPTVEWTLRNPRTKETRTFEQSELTIEGEARLLALVQQTAQALSATAFPWDKLAALFDPAVAALDWTAGAEMLGMISTQLPDVVAEAAVIFLGIYADNEDGTRNGDYDDDKRFLRSALNFTRFVDLVKTFAQQNDYQRLSLPFGRALEAGARMMPPQSGA
jgi:hypothetical protein